MTCSPTSLHRPASIADVLARMQSIDSALPEGDGIAAFNRLYWKTTQEVNEAVKNARFLDQPFMEQLDVEFANRYFNALDAFVAEPTSAPSAWAPLFESRAANTTRIQFAIAGMNAHINFDLAMALVTTARLRGVTLATGSPQHSDYLQINAVLAQTQSKVKAWFLTGLVGAVDGRVLGPVDDRLELWSISRARDAAWTNGEVLFALGIAAPLAAAFAAALSRSVGLTSRALLLPSPALALATATPDETHPDDSRAREGQTNV